MNDKELSDNLKMWFKLNENNSRKWADTLTGNTIRTYLKQWGYWKDLARWHPSPNEIQRNMAKNRGEIPYKKDGDSEQF